MGRPRTADHRTMLSAVVDRTVVDEVQAIWSASDRKRWEVVEEILRLGLEAYRATPKDHRSGQETLLRAG